MIKNRKHASVKVRGNRVPVDIFITSDDKPEIRTELKEKWQNLIDVMADCLAVPAGLIMKLDQKKISVFVTSRTAGNPYHAEDSEHLLCGLYCETAVGTDSKLLIPDATEAQLWSDNPDIKLGMISYLGYPLKWPDGEIFGTLCVLDSRKNMYSEKYIKLMEILKETIEKDLANLLLNYNELLLSMNELRESNRMLEDALSEKDVLISEIHHRVKNNMQIISSLIELQCSNHEESALRNQLSTIKDRIRAMGIVHEILYNSKNFREIRLHDYIERLISNLDISLTGDDVDNEYRIFIDKDLTINFESAIPIGLIINEIVTNSIKHAFPDKKTGIITVAVNKQPGGFFIIEASDNGCGMPEKKKDNNGKGLGRKLIDLLSRQMDGTVEYRVDNGTSYSVEIKITNKEENRWKRKS